MTDDPVVEIVRTIEAPREAVFRAWTDPDELRRWWDRASSRAPRRRSTFVPAGPIAS
jgi:uncharacterized protein YndB with AHSA1/START domain